LYTVALFKLAADRFKLFWHVHHLLVDGWSLALIHNRLAAVYTALAAGLAGDGDAMPPLRLLRASDEAYRSSTRLDRDRRSWLGRLAGCPEPVRLSARPSAAPGEVWRRRTDLRPAQLQALRAAADRFGVPWTSLAVALTALYVGRMTNAPEVTLGMPVSGRLGRVERGVPGMTTNAVPLRLSIDPHTALGDFARQVDSALREALLHGRYRTEDLSRDLGLLGTERLLWGPVVNIMAFDYDLRFAE